MDENTKAFIIIIIFIFIIIFIIKHERLKKVHSRSCEWNRTHRGISSRESSQIVQEQVCAASNQHRNGGRICIWIGSDSATEKLEHVRPRSFRA
jgi:hypothetical protein